MVVFRLVSSTSVLEPADFSYISPFLESNPFAQEKRSDANARIENILKIFFIIQFPPKIKAECQQE